MRMKTLVSAMFVSVAVSAPAFAEDLVFNLSNSSSLNLQELYVSASDTEAWGEDILGRDVLASGEAGDVTIADGRDVCGYDMRFVMDNGSTIEGSADLCENSVFTISD